MKLQALDITHEPEGFDVVGIFEDADGNVHESKKIPLRKIVTRRTQAFLLVYDYQEYFKTFKKHIEIELLKHLTAATV